MAVALSFEQAPPIWVPLRFFLTAPLFGVLAGAVLLWTGPEILLARGSLPAFALTHLVTLGFMLQAMCGALLQISPVAAGANVWRPRLVAAVAHVGLSAGAILLAGGFFLAEAALFRWAVPALGVSLLFFCAVMLAALIRTPAKGPTIQSLRIAVGGFSVTVALGVAIAGGLGGLVPVPVATLTPIHAAWALFGWSLMLVIGVSYLVVPMFQLTPPYPAKLATWLPRALLGIVAAWTLAAPALAPGSAPRTLLALSLLAPAAVFAAVTLWLQSRRRRKVTDSTLWFFRTAMIAMLAGTLLAPVAAIAGDGLRERLELAIGVLLLVGFFVSAINGMLYKIVPFLAWLHLQRVMPMPPNMNQMIAEKRARHQLWAHWCAMAMLLIAVALPPAGYLAGAAVVVSNALLAANLVAATRRYVRFHRAAIAAQGS